MASEDAVKRQTRQVLDLLRVHPDGITGLDALRDAGVYRLSGRILELRQAGFDITCDRSDGYGRYVLREAPRQLSLSDDLIREATLTPTDGSFRAMTPLLLGPCRCQGCGRPVWWNGFAWNDRFLRMLRRQVCAAERAA